MSHQRRGKKIIQNNINIKHGTQVGLEFRWSVQAIFQANASSSLRKAALCLYPVIENVFKLAVSLYISM